MSYLSGVLAPRYLVVLLAILLVLLAVILLVSMHLGGIPTLVQSTEGILD